MAYNKLNYLLKVEHTQKMIAELYEESAGFGTLMWMWRRLRKEKRCFDSYNTFLRYASEPRVAERIRELNRQNRARRYSTAQMSLF